MEKSTGRCWAYLWDIATKHQNLTQEEEKNSGNTEKGLFGPCKALVPFHSIFLRNAAILLPETIYVRSKKNSKTCRIRAFSWHMCTVNSGRWWVTDSVIICSCWPKREKKCTLAVHPNSLSTFLVFNQIVLLKLFSLVRQDWMKVKRSCLTDFFTCAVCFIQCKWQTIYSNTVQLLHAAYVCQNRYF